VLRVQPDLLDVLLVAPEGIQTKVVTGEL